MINNKRIIGLLAASTCFFLLTDAIRKSTGAHPSSTLAPGEQSCAQISCHANATITDGAAVNKLLLSGTTDTYEPDKTYDVTLSVTKAAIQRFGFQIVALKDADNSNAGTFKLTQTDRTQLQTGSGALSTRSYVTHMLNGTPALTSGFNEWKFSWTAPAKNEGNISFYYVTNCTNNNGSATGDALFKSKVTIRPSSASIKEQANPYHINAYYNRLQKTVVVAYQLTHDTNVRFAVCDAAGRLVKATAETKITAGNDSFTLNCAELSSGIYFINVIMDAHQFTQQLIVI